MQAEVCNSSKGAAGSNVDNGCIDTEGVATIAVSCSSTGSGAGCGQHVGEAAERGGRRGPYVEAAISEAEHIARIGIGNRVGIGAGGGAGQIGDRVSVQRAAGTHDNRRRGGAANTNDIGEAAVSGGCRAIHGGGTSHLGEASGDIGGGAAADAQIDAI